MIIHKNNLDGRKKSWNYVGNRSLMLKASNFVTMVKDDKLGISGMDLQLKSPISGSWGSWLISESCAKGQWNIT